MNIAIAKKKRRINVSNTNDRMIAIKVIPDFSFGDYNCISCGKKFALYHNDGELDEHTCCNLVYRTEYKILPDLVIYEKRDKETQDRIDAWLKALRRTYE